MNLDQLKNNINMDKHLQRVDLYLSLLVLICGIAFLSLGLLKDLNTLKQVSIVLLGSSGIYLVFRKQFLASKDSLMDFKPSKNLFLVTSIIFFVLFTVALLMYNSAPYYRPLSFVVVLSIMAGFISAQIFLADEKKYYYFILLEIIILGILIRATIFYQFPSIIGGDPWSHYNYISYIANLGHVTTEGVKTYFSFPLMHIFGAIVQNITHIGVKNTMFIISALELIVPVFFFVIISKIFNEKIGLLSALLLVTSTHFIQYGFLIIPQSFALIFMGMAIYLIFDRQLIDNFYKKTVYTVLILIFLISTLLTHTIASFALFLVLCSIFIVDLFISVVNLSEKAKISLSSLKNVNYSITMTLVFFFGVTLMSYWMYRSGMIGYFAETFNWGIVASSQAPSVSTLQESIITSIMKLLPLYMVIFLSLIGLFYSLNSKYYKNITIYGWPLLLFVFGSVVFGLNTILPARWFVFLEMLLVVPMAIAIISMARISPRKVFTIFIIVCLSSMIFMVNYEANAMNVNPYTPYPTDGSKKSELQALKSIYELSPPKMIIYRDLGFHSPLDYSSNTIGNQKIIRDASKIFAGQENLSGILIFRTGLITDSYYTSALGGGHYSVANLDHSIIKTLNLENKIYDSGTVFAFYREYT